MTTRGDDFVPFVTAPTERASAIAGLLRQLAHEIRLESNAPNPPAATTTVHVRSARLADARALGNLAHTHHAVKWQHRFDGPMPKCAKCGYGLKGLEAGQCPECRSWFLLPANTPLHDPPEHDSTMRTSHVIAAPLDQARFIALMLRDRWIDARLAEDDPAPDSDPRHEPRASVTVPRRSFSDARRALDDALKHGVRWRTENGRPVAICTACDHEVQQPHAAGRCPVCHQWIILLEGAPTLSELRRRQVEKMHAGTRILIACVLCVAGLCVLAAMVYKIIWWS